MEAYYHKQKNQYVFVAQRCGTNFLNSKLVRRLGWRKVDHHRKLKLDNDTVIFKVIRDPGKRFTSWLENFVLSEENHIFYSVKQTHRWLMDFQRTMSLDPHTEKLCILYNISQIEQYKTVYVAMENLNLLLGVSPVPRIINFRKKLDKLPKEIQLILQHFTKNIYHDDYEWIKTLTLLTF